MPGARYDLQNARLNSLLRKRLKIKITHKMLYLRPSSMVYPLPY